MTTIKVRRSAPGAAGDIAVRGCYGATMAGPGSIFGRLRVAMLVILTLVFAMPAFESHACAAEPASQGLSAVVEPASTTDEVPGCEDCGPACANGCCHAPHLAVMPDFAAPRLIVGYSVQPSATDITAPPARRPDGPDRPPRA